MNELLKRLEDGFEEFFEEFDRIPAEDLIKEMEELGIMFSEEDNTDTVHLSNNSLNCQNPILIFDQDEKCEFDIGYTSELLCCA